MNYTTWVNTLIYRIFKKPSNYNEHKRLQKVLQSSFSFKNHYTKWKNVRKTVF